MFKFKKFGNLGTTGNVCENTQEPSVSFNSGQHVVRAPTIGLSLDSRPLPLPPACCLSNST